MAKDTAPPSTFTPGETNARAVRHPPEAKQTPQRDAKESGPQASTDTSGTAAAPSSTGTAATEGRKRAPKPKAGAGTAPKKKR